MLIAAGRTGVIRAAMVAVAGPRHPAVSRQAGQQLARTELSKAMYHPSVPWTVRLERWLNQLLNAAGRAVPGGWWALVALAALAVVVAAAVATWIGPVARSRPRTHDPVLPGGELSARDHRQNAERLAAAGDFTAAIIETVRAIAVELQERSILPPRVGRTADELAAEAGSALPAHAAGFEDAARLFDEVRYGQRAGTADGYRRVRDLDAGIQAARPATPVTRPRASASAGRAA
jgi:hypothetical protein